MNRLPLLLTATAFALLAACVTINVYFPAAAAQAAADRVIDEVWGRSAEPAPRFPAKGEESSSLRNLDLRLLGAASLNFLIPTAQAADPDLDVSSPTIKALTSNMEARFPQIEPYLDSGVVGVGSDGFLATPKASEVPLAQRNKVRTLLANENADRSALYREIAAANGKPQWETQIREVFAARWIARAKSGWMVQTDINQWQKKP